LLSRRSSHFLHSKLTEFAKDRHAVKELRQYCL
jgi:hypothetical protein